MITIINSQPVFITIEHRTIVPNLLIFEIVTFEDFMKDIEFPLKFIQFNQHKKLCSSANIFLANDRNCESNSSKYTWLILLRFPLYSKPLITNFQEILQPPNYKHAPHMKNKHTKKCRRSQLTDKRMHRQRHTQNTHTDRHTPHHTIPKHTTPYHTTARGQDWPMLEKAFGYSFCALFTAKIFKTAYSDHLQILIL